MKDTIKDRLILLAEVQESMTAASDQMTEWDKSQLIMEKSAFDSLNLSDHVMKLSGEGSMLISRLLECCQSVVKNPSIAEQRKMTAVLEEIHNVFYKINEYSYRISEISHTIEAEAAAQRCLEESIRNTLTEAGVNLNTVAACVELAMTEI